VPGRSTQSLAVMKTARGHCPKCGVRLWLGAATDTSAAMRFEPTEDWLRLSFPKLVCRKCGVKLAYADRRAFFIRYVTWFASLLTVAVVAMWLWGSLGLIAAIPIAMLGIPFLMRDVEYVEQVGQHDS
jgi:hypothetical protein